MQKPLEYKSLCAVLDHHPNMPPYLRHLVESGSTTFTDRDGVKYWLKGGRASGLITREVSPAATRTPAPSPTRSTAHGSAVRAAAHAAAKTGTSNPAPAAPPMTRRAPAPAPATTPTRGKGMPTRRCIVTPALIRLGETISKRFGV